MITTRVEHASPTQAEALALEVGGFVVRAVQVEGRTGPSEAEARGLAADMLKQGFARVGIYRLNSIVTKDRS